MVENVTDALSNCDDDFPDRLLNAITNKFKSTRQFSLASSIPASSLAQYLKGVSEPTRPVLCAMAQVLGVNVSWLATGKETATAVASAQALDAELLEEIIELVDSHFKFEKARIKSSLITKIYAYILKKRAEREASKEKDTAEIIDLIEVLKAAV